MRDPNRIDPFLRAFGRVWKRNPDMRFGQLFMNLSREEDGFADTWKWEDDIWLDRMKEFPSADQIEEETEARLNEALRLLQETGDADAALAHLFGRKEN